MTDGIAVEGNMKVYLNFWKVTVCFITTLYNIIQRHIRAAKFSILFNNVVFHIFWLFIFPSIIFL